MKRFSLLLPALAACQYGDAFTPATMNRPFVRTILHQSTDVKADTAASDPSIYSEGPKNELDMLRRSGGGLFSHKNALIPGSEFEDIPIHGKPLAKVVGTVRAPLDQVWELARPFGSPDVTKWWKIYKDDKVELDGPDKVGVQRKFTVGPRTTTELLAERDDSKHRFVYKLSGGEGYPTGYYGTTTVVEMKAKGDSETEVTWQSWSHVHHLIMEVVADGQANAYKGAIASLDNYFNPATGTLDVTVKSAEGLPSDTYAVIEAGDNNPQQTEAGETTFSFDLFKDKETIKFTLMSAAMGQDKMLGSGSYEIDTNSNDFKDGHVDVTLDITGEVKGKVTLGLDFEADGYKKKLAAPPSALESRFNVDTMKVVVGDLINKAFDAMVVYNMGEQKEIEYARYQEPNEDLPRAAKGLPYMEQLRPDKLGLIFQRLSEYLYSQADWPVENKKETLVERLGRSMTTNLGRFIVDKIASKVFDIEGDRFLAFYGQYIKPTNNTENLVKNCKEDEEQARQYLNGMFPLMISMVQSLDDIPDIPLKKVQLGGESLESLIERKALFFVDYKHLDNMKLYRDMIFYAPYGLIYKPRGSEKLTMGGVQLERKPDSYVYTNNPKETDVTRWRYARLQLSCADNQYHQFIYHLGYGHLAMEPHIVAVHNSFPDTHIVKKLLKPHFKDTIGINFLARQTLVSEVKPITDRTFSPGTAQAMELFLKAWKEYDFYENNFVNDLKNRGFTEDLADGVKDYLYREDGFKIWNAIGNYVTKVVDHEYDDDKDVEKDAAIQKWAVETSSPDKADIPGFPDKITTKAGLIEILQIIIWNVSAAHAVVNFSQYDYLSYIPNRPNVLFEKMPEGKPLDPIPNYDTEFLDRALPDNSISHFEILFSWLLTTPPQITLDKVDAMKDVVPEAHESFQKELAQIHHEIKTRNDELGAAGLPNYPYLDPTKIEASIAI